MSIFSNDILQHEYKSEHFDLIAIFFSIVKIMYVTGCLSVLPELIALIGK